MSRLIFLLASLAVCHGKPAAKVAPEDNLLTEGMVDYINGLNTTWRVNITAAAAE